MMAMFYRLWARLGKFFFPGGEVADFGEILFPNRVLNALFF
jgi:hypothetical protein